VEQLEALRIEISLDSAHASNVAAEVCIIVGQAGSDVIVRHCNNRYGAPLGRGYPRNSSPLA
jgi:hypothetical protein